MEKYYYQMINIIKDNLKMIKYKDKVSLLILMVKLYMVFGKIINLYPNFDHFVIYSIFVHVFISIIILSYNKQTIKIIY
jgi:hypothetical protein